MLSFRKWGYFRISWQRFKCGWLIWVNGDGESVSVVKADGKLWLKVNNRALWVERLAQSLTVIIFGLVFMWYQLQIGIVIAIVFLVFSIIFFRKICGVNVLIPTRRWRGGVGLLDDIFYKWLKFWNRNKKD